MYEAAFPARVKWYEIGMGLKIDIGKLDTIAGNEVSAAKCLSLTLQEWLQSGTDCSWASLKKVLESSIVGCKYSASKLPPY